MPRAAYDSVVIETMFDYHYFLDKVADYLFRTFDQVGQHKSAVTSRSTPQRKAGVT